MILELIYLITASLLAVYGLQALFLTLIARWAMPDPAAAPPAELEDPPSVTVQLPVYNERHVVRRLIDAAAAFDWPADRIQIQLLDDSTDDTSKIIAQSVAFHRQKRYRHRSNAAAPTRQGYKAGRFA